MGSLQMVATMIERTVAGIVIAVQTLGSHRNPPGPAISIIRTVQRHEQLEQLRFVAGSQATVGISTGTTTASAASNTIFLGLPKRKAVTQARNDGAIVSVTREQELWAMALWVDREHGKDGERFNTQRVLHFDVIGHERGKQLWMDVARKFVELRSSVSAAPN